MRGHSDLIQGGSRIKRFGHANKSKDKVARERLREKLPEMHRPHLHSEAMNETENERDRSGSVISALRWRAGLGHHSDKSFSSGMGPTLEQERLLQEQHVLKAGPLLRMSGLKSKKYWAALRASNLTFYASAGVRSV